MSRVLCLSILFLPSLALVLQAGESALKYPKTKRGNQVDDYHGVKVADPYRWLEGDVHADKDVAEWIAEENKVTFAYLAGIPQRDAIKKRLTDLWDYEKINAPAKVGPRQGGSYYVFSKNNGLQNQYAYYTQETLKSEPKLLLDPNTWSKDGTVSLAGAEFSEDGKLLAYGVSESGSDWNTWKVMEVAGRKVLTDELRWIKFSGASWSHDGKGFYYSRFPASKPGEKSKGPCASHEAVLPSRRHPAK